MYVIAGRDFVGRDKISYGSSPSELATAFVPLLQAVQQHALPGVRPQALAKVTELQAELQMYNKPDDHKVAGLIESLTAMVTNAIGSVVKMFAAPILQGLVGPATKYVLGKLQ